MYFHDVAARDGLVQSAQSPARSGVLNRRLDQALHNIQVDYAGRAVGPCGQVIQFRYGGDGLDWQKMRRCAVGGQVHDMPFDLERLVEESGAAEGGTSSTSGAPEFPLAAPKLRAALRARLARVRPGAELDALVAAINDRLDWGQIAAGEAVGAVAATSISEQVTQRALDAFHSVGDRSKDQATQTTPRLEELLYARETIDVPRITVTLPSREQALEFIARVSKQQQVLECHTLRPEHLLRPWVARWRQAGLPCAESPDAVFLTLDRAAFAGWRFLGHCMHSHEEHDQALEMIVYTHGSSVSEVLAAFVSPDRFADSARADGSTVTLIVRGPWAMQRVARLLPDDCSPMVSTDVVDTLRTYGIEAARASLLEQCAELQSFSGVNLRHLMLVVDAMTWSGRVLAATGAGMGRQLLSPLGKACFEKPVPPLVVACVERRREVATDVSYCIATGAKIPLGSATCHNALLLDEETLAAAFPPEAELPECPAPFGGLAPFGGTAVAPRAAAPSPHSAPLDVTQQAIALLQSIVRPPVTSFATVYDPTEECATVFVEQPATVFYDPVEEADPDAWTPHPMVHARDWGWTLDAKKQRTLEL